MGYSTEPQYGFAVAAIYGLGTYMAKLLSNPQMPKNILIRVYENRGYGDIVFALKMSEAIKSKFPDSSIFLWPHGAKEKQDLVEIFKQNTDQIIDDVQAETFLKNNPKISIIIRGPSSIGALEKIDTKATQWFISEYSMPLDKAEGVSKNHLLFSGLAEKEIGIFCDESIKKLSKSPRKLAALENESLFEVLSDQPFYFGYLYSIYSPAHFVRLILAKEYQKKENVIICLPNKRLVHPELRDRVWNFIMKEFEQVPHEFSTVEVYSLDSENNWKLERDCSYDSKVGKNCKIYFPGSVSKSDFDNLRQASNDFICVTGDQSISEAISNEKIFAYEALSHKNQFFRNLVAFAKKHHLDKAARFLDLSLITADIIRPIDVQEIQKLFEDPEVQKEFVELSDKIFQYKNIQKNILKTKF